MIEAGIVMDPLTSLDRKKDSTLAMILAARRRGWQVYTILQGDLHLFAGDVWADMAPVDIDLAADPFYRTGDSRRRRLEELDVVLMRKDPPFDLEYVYSTYLLERVEARGVLVSNRPASLRDCNEKLFATAFPECGPPLVVSRRDDVLRTFVAAHDDVILKPLDAMGGGSIFRVRQNDPNLSVIIETLTEHGGRQTMAQRYIPEIADGDKRILLVDGAPVPYALARVPAAGETRGNLAAGGRGEARPLTERDRWICTQVGPELERRGLHFVGLDVIGDYLTEVNVTCPTCVRELDAQCGLDIGMQLMQTLEDHLAAAAGDAAPA